MNNTTNDSSTELPKVEESNDSILLTGWVLVLIAALIFPFCRGKRQRKLCRQRIRERRWITDDGFNEDDWYYARYLRQREERRLEELEKFRIHTKQQDEIREQYLVLLLRRHTMVRVHVKLSFFFGLRSHAVQKKTLSSNDFHTTDVNFDHLTSASVSLCERIPATDDVGPAEESLAIDVETAPVSSFGDTEKWKLTTNHEMLDNDENEVTLEEMAVDGAREMVSVPVPGHKMILVCDDPVPGAREQTISSHVEMRRQVPSGCAICLSQFSAEERISWASNSECPHVFHHDCLLRWFQAVGSKDQKKQLRQNPDMSGEEALNLICKFPKLCPCCRQQFCTELEEPPPRDDSEGQALGNVAGGGSAEQPAIGVSSGV